MIAVQKIKEQLEAKGFIELPGNKVPKNLLWQADLLYTKDNFIYLILVKSNNSVPPAYLNRIGSIPREDIIPLIIFCQKPVARDEKIILSLGISLGYFINDKISNLKIQKKIPQQVVAIEIKRKLSVIDIFVSSKQDIAERKFVENRIENLRKINSYPFNPPHLIEHDKFDINSLYDYIDSVLLNCEWIVIILEDEYSPVVSYEINKAIDNLEHENIFMFVKLTNTCKTSWENELAKIKDLASKSIKYLPYSDHSELEVGLSKAIKTRMNEICKKEKIELFS
jgi:hypothetical protein